mmetsp:Transcript_20056/g.28075  ORF Transcript_20056/g.28075 Transcript_20056/m.28075 type:complete len:334 (+) Transcript_20056:252-1253(+)
MLNLVFPSNGLPNTDVELTQECTATSSFNTCARTRMLMPTTRLEMVPPPTPSLMILPDQLPWTATTTSLECTSHTLGTKLARPETETRVSSLLTELLKEDLTTEEEVQSSPDKTTMETDMDTNALKRETTTHTGLLLHGEMLPSSPTTLTGAISTSPNPKTRRTDSNALMVLVLLLLLLPREIANLPLDTNGKRLTLGVFLLQLARELLSPEKTTLDTDTESTTTSSTGPFLLNLKRDASRETIATAFSDSDTTSPLEIWETTETDQTRNSLTGRATLPTPLSTKTTLSPLKDSTSSLLLIPPSTEEPSKTDLTSSTFKTDLLMFQRTPESST